MGILKGTLLILAVCLSVSAPVVTGLRCYVCNYFKLKSSDARATEALSALTSASDENCQDRRATRKAPQMCSKGYECRKTDFTMIASMSGVTLKMDVVTRDCFRQTIGFSDRCHTLNDKDKAALEAAFGSKVTVSSFEGTGCLCSTDLCNGQPSITAEKFLWPTGILLVVLTRYL